METHERLPYTSFRPRSGVPDRVRPKVPTKDPTPGTLSPVSRRGEEREESEGDEGHTFTTGRTAERGMEGGRDRRRKKRIDHCLTN